jgi:hypothetical protein
MTLTNDNGETEKVIVVAGGSTGSNYAQEPFL